MLLKKNLIFLLEDAKKKLNDKQQLYPGLAKTKEGYKTQIFLFKRKLGILPKLPSQSGFPERLGCGDLAATH